MTKRIDNIWDTGNEKNENLHIVDETLRDGLQFPYSVKLTIDQKIKCIEFMNHESAISDIIVGMSGRGKNNYNEIKKIINHVSKKKQAWVLSRMIINDIHEIARLNLETKKDIGVNLFIAVSEIRLIAEEWTLEDQLKKLEYMLNYCTKNFNHIRVAIEDFSRTSRNNILEVLKVISKFSVERITLADTAGILTTKSTINSVSFVKKFLKKNKIESELEWHSHNDRGLALANSIECVNLGIKFIHATVRGIGERNGNTPLELMIKNIYKDNYDYDNLNNYFNYITKLFTNSLDRLYPFFGLNTNLTSTGTHTAAMCKLLQKGYQDLALNLFTTTINKKNKIDDAIVLTELTGKETFKFFLKTSFKDNNIDAIIQASKEYIEKNEKTLTPKELLRLIKAGQIYT